jgi:hypothetical protein
VHLGNLSSIKGPAGEPRYVPGSCGAGTRGDTVAVGAAVTAPIDCRTCTRSNPVRVAWINATVIAATSEPVTLPHTGLTVPHTQLRVDGPTQPGPGRVEQHRLYLGARFVGWITTHPHRSATYRTNSLGGRELDEYAQQCRLFTGEPPAAVADVLAELVREHLTAADVAERLAASRTPVRLMQHVRDGDGQPHRGPVPDHLRQRTADHRYRLAPRGSPRPAPRLPRRPRPALADLDPHRLDPPARRRRRRPGPRLTIPAPGPPPARARGRRPTSDTTGRPP